MSHAISAFIARQPAMASLSTALGNAPFFSIRNDGLFFLPVTDEIFDHATMLKGDSDPVADGYYRFSGSLAAIACVNGDLSLARQQSPSRTLTKPLQIGISPRTLPRNLH